MINKAPGRSYASLLVRTASVVLVTVVLLFTANSALAQSSTDGATPAGLAPGSPTGSYALSDFDVVNLYNGGLNFRLPLYQIGGRGEAGYPITLHVQKKWTVHKHLEPGVGAFYFADAGWWSEEGAGLKIFAAGKVDIRSARREVSFSVVETLTRITFTAPDGTEYELRDQLSNGQPVNPVSGGFNRGTVFVTADGTSATFVSDWDIHDDPTYGQGFYDDRPDGYLMLKNGTRFRVDDGKISWMRDRNGNKVSFTYDPSRRVTSVTDSLNRQVTITYPSTTTGFTDISYKGFGGDPRTIRIGQTNLASALRSGYSLQTATQLFPELNGGGPVDATVVNSIQMPNGRSYQLSYNSYGELARLVLPTGGAIEYDYAAGLTDGAASGVFSDPQNKYIYRRLIERRIYPDGGSGLSYESKITYSRPETTTASLGYVVTETYNNSGALLAKSQHHFHGSPRASFLQKPTQYGAWKDGREYKTEIFDTNGSTILKRVEHSFAQRASVSWWTGTSDTAPPNDPRPTETITTIEPASANLVSKQTFGYDATVSYNNQNNVKAYGFGTGSPGSLIRETRTTFVNSSSYTDNAVHLRGLPSQISIYDGANSEKSRTVYEYDNYATDSNHAALTNRLNISGFDSSFGTSYTTRGNATATTQHFMVNGSSTGSISSYAQYDIAGNVVKAIDARGNATTIFYTDCFGAPNGEAQTSTDPTELGSTTKSFAFATEVRNALNQSTFAQFDYYLGQPVDGKDVNGIVASGYFDDDLDRPTEVRRAVGTALQNRSLFTYDDANRVVTTTSDRDTNNDGILLSKQLYDQMGRAIETRRYEGGANYITTQTQYDALGRAFKTSNPFRPWQSETAAWTTRAFDALGRVVSITTPDNAVVTSSYSGNSTTVSDQIGKQRKSVTDALGRLIEVYEVPNDASINYLTSYTYDTLDNLTSVTQGSQTPRGFLYDSLKRLISTTNPESGTTNYQYDNNGNLLVKTDARGVSIHSEYDVLNRPARRWYNGSTAVSSTVHNSPALPSGVGTTNELKLYYDSQSLPSGAPSYTRGSVTGRLVAQTYGSSSNGDYFAYDALGRQTLKIQQTGSINYQMSHVYNLAGGVTSLTYPSSHTISNSYDAAGRLMTFSGTIGDGVARTYSNEIVYSSFGSLAKEKFGTTTPIYNKLFYNVRGQLAEIRESTSYTGPTDYSADRGALVNNYSNNCTGICGGSSMVDNNGNLRKQEIHIPGQPLRTQDFTYDSLNRLESALETRTGFGQQWKQKFDYDRWGNRTINAALSDGGVNETQFEKQDSTNRLYAPGDLALDENLRKMQYDAVGNLKSDIHTGAGIRSYDGENKLTSALGGNSQTQTYSYDASGQRIKRTINGVETWQVYGFGGELLGEYSANGAANSPQKEFGYRNGQMLVTASGGSRINVAAAANGGTATASQTHSAPYAPSGAINGDRKLYLNNNAWSNTTATMPQWLQVDFNGSKTIDEIDVFSVQDLYTTPSEPTLTMTFSTYGLTAFQAQYWDGAAWVTLPNGNVTGNSNVWKKITFSPVTTTKIRVWITGSIDNYSRVTEVEAWGTSVPVSRHNVAAAANGGTATASQTHSAPYAPSGAINGDRKLYLNNNAWSNTTATMPQWLQVDFNGSKTIDEIDVFSVQDLYTTPSEPTPTMTFSTYGLTAFQAQYWDGAAWVTVPNGNVTGNNYVWKQITFSSITTTKIRVWITGSIDNYSRITEVEAWGVPAGSGGAAANIQWLVSDHLGTPRMIFDETGSLANMKRHDYLPFGEELMGGTDANPGIGGRKPSEGYATGDALRQQFTGKERDVETSLDYFLARYYSSVQGRFTSIDPLMASAKSSNPQTWNRYSYSLNRPLTFADPDGMMARECTKATPCTMTTEDKAMEETKRNPDLALVQETVTVTIPSLTEIQTVETILAEAVTLRETQPQPAVETDDSLWAGALASEMHKRAVPMAQTLEVAAAVAVAEVALPVVALEAAGAGVATLGLQTETAVIGSQVNTAAYAGQAGFNVLRGVSNWTWQGTNVPWLNHIISSGQSVIVLGGNYWTQREVQYLMEQGKYVWNSGFDKLVPGR